MTPLLRGLTRREEQALALLAAGLSDAEIGRELGIRENTVGNVLSRVYLKLGVGRRLDAAAAYRELAGAAA